MAELIITTFLTLDGVMQSPGGPTEDPSENFSYGGWLVPYFDEVVGAAMAETFSKVDAFLIGRRTYDIFAAYWPNVTGEEGKELNTLPKFVASRTQSTFSWNNTSHIKDVVKEVPGLKQRFAREVQVHGSCGLAQTLIENDLIDEYRLLTFPVVIGTGKRLFGAGAIPSALKLVRCHTSGSGVTISIYRRAGSLKTASL
jgi:dihydrofolate reductase